MNTRNQTFVALALLAAVPAAAQQGVSSPGDPTHVVLPPPPGERDAGGGNQPNIGMHHIKKTADAFGGKLPSAFVDLPAGIVPPENPPPLGWVRPIINLYFPDVAPVPGGDQAALNEILVMDRPAQYPEPLWFNNTDPSGSLDETALDERGQPIHFNLHYPQGEPARFDLADFGMSPNSPTDDLNAILADIAATGSQARVQEALDILLGTNASGALTDNEYNGFPLLRYESARDNQTYDPQSRNIVVKQLWYGTEIRSDCEMLLVPDHGDYTITWQVRGLGDTGANGELAFPIDEFTPMIMRKTSNADFWQANGWIWKWFAAVEHQDGRKYTLESLYDLHTGTEAAPSYADLNPGDPRYWLRADRKFDIGSYVGQGDLFDFSPFHSYDLDQDGQIGGFLVDGTDTGAAYDGTTNASAQFNQYGNNEYAVPRIDWSMGPFHIPYFSYDSSFTTIRKGEGFDVTIRYSDGEMQAGIYNWGWRVHPPRINWIETYSEKNYLPSGAPKNWRFGHKWDDIAALGLGAIGDFAPEKQLHDALVVFGASAGAQADVDAFNASVEGLMGHIEDRRGLPETPGVAGFPNAAADVNFLYTNFDIYADRENISAPGKRTWAAGDVITITIYNDDNVERYFRVVDFGTTDYQYNGTDMGLLDWKPVWGFPQLAARAWGPPLGSLTEGFASQGKPLAFWAGTGVAANGNPFYVDPNFQDLANFWPAGERDLVHHFANLDGFSGPGFASESTDPFSVWADEFLSGKPTGDPNIWNYSYGKPIPPKTVATFEIEMPRAAALNNGAMYMFDPQFHSSAIFTMHPESEMQVEGLAD